MDVTWSFFCCEVYIFLFEIEFSFYVYTLISLSVASSTLRPNVDKSINNLRNFFS